MSKIYKQICQKCKNYYENSSKKFCSWKCYLDTKPQKVKINCSICNKELLVKFGKRNTTKFCSQFCYHKSPQKKEWMKSYNKKTSPWKFLGAKGKHWKLSVSTRKKMSENHVGNKGKKASWETKQKMSLSRLGKVHKMSEEGRKRIREAVLKSIPNRKSKFRNTIPELLVEKELIKNNINYQKQIPLCNISCVDFFLPETKTVIFVDGDYWHTRNEEVQKRDEFVNNRLMENGFSVYRFWESEIKNTILLPKLLMMV